MTQSGYDLPSFAIRWASRETLRRAALRCTMFFCAARMMTGSASAMAASALDRSPAAIASSTLRTAPRRRDRRDLLTTVRRVIWRAAFLAIFVGHTGKTGFCERSGAYRGAAAAVNALRGLACAAGRASRHLLGAYRFVVPL